MASLSLAAQKIINEYLTLPFKTGGVQCPYYNNDRLKLRAGLRVLVGKGSPADILEEAMIISLHEKQDLTKLSPVEIKKFLVDHRLGIDCSGLAYYVLDAELKARGQANLAHYLKFPGKNFIRQLLIKLRPVENTGVATLADERNSVVVAIGGARPGDFITMQNPNDASYMSHVIIIHQVDYARPHPTLSLKGEGVKTPAVIHYTHSIPWRTNGKYGHGARQGTITIQNPSGGLLEQLWTENNASGEQNETYADRARGAAELAIRRLRALG